MIPKEVIKETIEVLFERAVKQGDDKAVNELLTTKRELANTTLSNKAFPLMLAAKLGHEKIAVLLINSGANVDARITENQQDYDALWLAARYGHWSIATLLLNTVRNVDAGGDSAKIKITPLFFAILKNNQAVIKTLREKGAKNTAEIESIEAALPLKAEVNPSAAHQAIIDRLYETGNRIALQGAQYSANCCFERVLELTHLNNESQINRIAEIKLKQTTFLYDQRDTFPSKMQSALAYLGTIRLKLKPSDSLSRSFMETSRAYLRFMAKRKMAEDKVMVVHPEPTMAEQKAKWEELQPALVLLENAVKFLPAGDLNTITTLFYFLTFIETHLLIWNNDSFNSLKIQFSYCIGIMKTINKLPDNYPDLEVFRKVLFAILSGRHYSFSTEFKLLFQHATRLKLFSPEYSVGILLNLSLLCEIPQIDRYGMSPEGRAYLDSACDILNKSDSFLLGTNSDRYIAYARHILERHRNEEIISLFLKTIKNVQIKYNQNIYLAEDYVSFIIYYLNINPPNIKEAGELLGQALKIPDIRIKVCVDLCELYFRSNKAAQIEGFFPKIFLELKRDYQQLTDRKIKIQASCLIALWHLREKPFRFQDAKPYLDTVLSLNFSDIKDIPDEEIAEEIANHLASCGTEIFNHYQRIPHDDLCQSSLSYAALLVEKAYHLFPTVYHLMDLIRNLSVLVPYPLGKINNLLMSSSADLFSDEVYPSHFSSFCRVVYALYDKKSYIEAIALFKNLLKLSVLPDSDEEEDSSEDDAIKTAIMDAISTGRDLLIHGLLEQASLDKALSFVVPIISRVSLEKHNRILFMHALLQEFTNQAFTKDTIEQYLSDKKAIIQSLPEFVQPPPALNAAHPLVPMPPIPVRQMTERLLYDTANFCYKSFTLYAGTILDVRSVLAEPKFNLSFDLRTKIALCAWRSNSELSLIPSSIVEKVLKKHYEATVPKFSQNVEPLLKNIPPFIRDTAKIAFHRYRNHFAGNFTKENAEVANKILARHLCRAIGGTFPNKILRNIIYKLAELMAQNNIWPTETHSKLLIDQAMGLELYIKNSLKNILAGIETGPKQKRISLLSIDQFNLMQKMGSILAQHLDLRDFAKNPQSIYEMISSTLKKSFDKMAATLEYVYNALQKNKPCIPSNKPIPHPYGRDYPAQTDIDDQVVYLHLFDNVTHKILPGGKLPITTSKIEQWYGFVSPAKRESLLAQTVLKQLPAAQDAGMIFSQTRETASPAAAGAGAGAPAATVKSSSASADAAAYAAAVRAAAGRAAIARAAAAAASAVAAAGAGGEASRIINASAAAVRAAAGRAAIARAAAAAASAAAAAGAGGEASRIINASAAAASSAAAADTSASVSSGSKRKKPSSPVNLPSPTPEKPSPKKKGATSNPKVLNPSSTKPKEADTDRDPKRVRL